MSCKTLEHAPWVCNGCPKFKTIYTRFMHFFYSAQATHRLSQEGKSESQSDIAMERGYRDDLIPDPARALHGLSPNEVTQAYAGKLSLFYSTIYRWVEAERSRWQVAAIWAGESPWTRPARIVLSFVATLCSVSSMPRRLSEEMASAFL